MKMLSVKLAKKWSGHEAGETVTVEDFTAESMVRKGYGQIVPNRPRPVVETAMAEPPVERAVAPPQIEPPTPPTPEMKDDADADASPKTTRRRGRKAGD
ncbi:MAG: hypothetical protein QM570_15495 [Planctomycetota bacterium]|nr:hypothetical protein [Planctomycetota bacterium]